MDESQSSWGGVLDWSLAQGSWTPEEARLSINILELIVIRLSMKCWKDRLHGLLVQIQLDINKAVAYVNHQGSTRSVTGGIPHSTVHTVVLIRLRFGHF